MHSSLTSYPRQRKHYRLVKSILVLSWGVAYMFIFRLVSRQIYHFSSSLNCILLRDGFSDGGGDFTSMVYCFQLFLESYLSCISPNARS